MPTRISDDEPFKGRHRLHPPQCPQHPLAPGLLKASARNLHVLLDQGLADISDIEAELAQSVGVHRHLHSPHTRSDQLDRSDILDGFQVLLKAAVHQKGQFLKIARRAHRHREDRGRIDLELVHDGCLGSCRESGKDRIDLVAYVLGGEVPVALEEELGGDRRDPFPAGGTQLLDALDGVDDLLHGLRDAGFDLLGRSAPQGRAHRDDGQLDIGDLLNAQLAERKPTHDDQQHVEHRGEDGPPDAHVRQPHPGGRFLGLGWCLGFGPLHFRTSTAMPSASLPWPLVTTDSPSETPDTISIRSPSTRPVFTTRD